MQISVSSSKTSRALESCLFPVRRLPRPSRPMYPRRRELLARTTWPKTHWPHGNGTRQTGILNLEFSLIYVSAGLCCCMRRVQHEYTRAGAHQMEPPSPLISWVNSFPSRFLNRTACFPRKVSYFREFRMSPWKKWSWMKSNSEARPSTVFLFHYTSIFIILQPLGSAWTEAQGGQMVIIHVKYMFFQLLSTIKVNLVAKNMQSAYFCIIFHVKQNNDHFLRF